MMNSQNQSLYDQGQKTTPQICRGSAYPLKPEVCGRGRKMKKILCQPGK